MGHRQAGRRVKGFCFIEIMVYIALMVIIGIPLTMVALAGSRSSVEGDMLSKILERNRSVLQRIHTEYRGSLAGTTVVSDDGRILGFISNGGFDGTGAVAGPPIRYVIRLAPGEYANGVDDNKNGLADEGVLMRTDKAAGQGIVLTNSLDTAGSRFRLNGTGVTITLTTFGRSASGEVSRFRRTMTIYPRN